VRRGGAFSPRREREMRACVTRRRYHAPCLLRGRTVEISCAGARRAVIAHSRRANRDGYVDHVPGYCLVVDDDDDIREATRDVMERHGYEVVAVSSGAEALAFLIRDTPDLVLLDLQMYDMNGWEVLGALRGNPRFEDVEVVVVTGCDEAVAPGVRVLRKPFKIESLFAVLGKDEKRAS
jgi:CheY-like chemotaxis protein